MKSVTLLLFPLLAFATDTWRPFVVDKMLTVQLPAAATEVNLSKLLPLDQTQRIPVYTRMWVVRTKEGMCGIMRIPNPDKLRINKNDTAQRRAFYERVERSALIEANARLLTHTTFSTAGNTGIEFKYLAPNESSGQYNVSYTRSLVLDSVSYSLIFRPANPTDLSGRSGAEQRRRFFNSIIVKP
jgi:hypothetical protein